MLSVNGFLETVKMKTHLWIMGFAGSVYATWWLGIFAFTESSFFIIPPDLLLITILSAGAERWWYYASISTTFSVLGGIFGYGIGLFVFDTVGVRLVELYNLQTQLETVTKLFADNAFLAILVAAFTPIPYKVFTITAGLLKINFITFVLASILGRGARLFLVAYFMKVFGKTMGEFIYKRFNQLSLLGGLLIIFVIIYLSFF